MYVKEETVHRITIEKSRFIAYLKPVFSEDEYREYLKEIRKRHYDATHVCSALICGNIKRSSDDGEPSGTAGVPILNVLEKKGLDNTCCLVVRYFGGIKLGTGGLVRAYGGACQEALKEAVIVEDISYPKYQLKLPYDTANKLDSILTRNTYLLEREYGEDVTITFVLKDESVLAKIEELTKGLKPMMIGEEKIEKVIE
ncbi:MAG: YigZ family protein [Erysipelotrichaceae bacterium]|nr:YigZ family protein [Erysipelotrichaceae bacterium]